MSDAAVLRLERAKELARWLYDVKSASRQQINNHMFLLNGLNEKPVTKMLKQMKIAGLVKLVGYRWTLTLDGKAWALT